MARIRRRVATTIMPPAPGPPKVAILVVNGFDRMGRWGDFNTHEARSYPWVDLCLKQIERHTREMSYLVYVWDNSALPEHRGLLEGRPNVTVLRSEDPDVNLPHGAALDRLRKKVPARTEFVLTLDTDSFPIRDGWLENLTGRLTGGVLLAGAWREELVERGLRPFVHPSCLAIRRSTMRELGVGFLGGQDVGQSVTEAVLAAGGRISRLRRSNAWNPHFLMGGIYGDLVYHQAAGSRSARFRLTDESDDDEVLRCALRNAAFRDLDRLLAVLTGDADPETAAELGLVRGAGAAETGGRRS